VTRLAFDRGGAVLRGFGFDSVILYDGISGARAGEQVYGLDTRFVTATQDGGKAVLSDSAGYLLLDTATDARERLPAAWFPKSDFHLEHEASLSSDLKLFGVYGCLQDKCDEPMVVEVFDLATKQSVARRTHGFISAGGTFTGGVTEDGRFVEFISNRADRVLVELESGRAGPSFGAQSVRSSDGRWVFDLPNFAEHGDMTLRDGRTGRTLVSLGHMTEVESGEFRSGAFCGSARLVVGSVDAVMVFALPTGRMVARFPRAQWQEVATTPDEEPRSPLVTCTAAGDRVAVGGRGRVKILAMGSLAGEPGLVTGGTTARIGASPTLR